MKNENYNCSINVNVPAKEAFEKVSQVSEWWAKDFKGTAKNLNDEFTVRWGDTFVTFKIDELVPDKKVVWLVTDCFLPFLNNKTEWNDTKAIFEFQGEGDHTKIHFTHEGLLPEIECYTMCTAGWDKHIKGSLVKLLNEGVGAPQ